MVNLIKVEPIIDEKRRTNVTATKTKILQSIFPDYDGEASNYNGVNFIACDNGSWSSPKITGIQIEAGNYGNMLRRRVIIKGGFIDTDAIKTKYTEVKVHADNTKESQRRDTEHRVRVEKAFESAIANLNPKGNWWRWNIYADTETTVRIEGKTDWRGLKTIQDTLGKLIKVNFELVVPIEHTKIIYEVLNPKESP